MLLLGVVASAKLYDLTRFFPASENDPWIELSENSKL